jgi:hypothetical protein
VVGSEGRDAYGEPDAVAGGADPAAEQACTWPAVLVRELEPLPVGDPPLRYAELRDAQPFSLDLDGPDSVPHRYRFFVDGPDGHPPFWEYRRVRRGTRDAAVINWAGNDFRGVGLVGDSERSHREARQLTLAFVHWLRTEVPRDPDDGAGPLGTGRGYPELRLAPELSGTPDGLASAPYVRESRRLANPRPVTWFDIRGTHSSPRPAPLPDSVGIAWYHADLHSRVGYSGTVFSETSPFQIPARALIPSAEVGAGNLLMGAKNLAATQVAASAYRVHPAEWAIGEAAGVIAAVSVAREISPRQTIDDPSGLAAVQRLLRDRGAPIEWPADVFASPWLMPEADTTSAPPSTTALARESPRPSSVPDLMRRDHA